MALTERNLRRIVARGMTVLLAGLGLFAVLLVLADALPRHFPRWEKLQSTKHPIEGWAIYREVLPPTLFVKMADGSVLQLGPGNRPSWWPAPPAPFDVSRIPFSSIKEPCDFSSKAFSLITLPPAGVRACLQSAQGAPVKSVGEAYALDAQGNLWRWRSPAYYGYWGRYGLIEAVPVFLVLYGGVSVGVIVESWALMRSLKKELRQARSTQRSV